MELGEIICKEKQTKGKNHACLRKFFNERAYEDHLEKIHNIKPSKTHIL